MKTYILKISDLSNETINELSNFISNDKKIKLERFCKKIDKTRCLLGDLLIRRIYLYFRR